MKIDETEIYEVSANFCEKKCCLKIGISGPDRTPLNMEIVANLLQTFGKGILDKKVIIPASEETPWEPRTQGFLPN